jgi:hypothetical protein
MRASYALTNPLTCAHRLTFAARVSAAGKALGAPHRVVLNRQAVGVAQAPPAEARLGGVRVVHVQGIEVAE